MPFRIDATAYPIRLTVWKTIPGNIRVNVESMNARLAREGRRMTEKLRADNRSAFQMGGHRHHGGRQWRGLSEVTIMRKGHAAPLIDGKQKYTSNMQRRQSVLGRTKIIGRKLVYEVKGINNAWYSHLHQFGFVHKSYGYVAPRPPIVFTGKDGELADSVLDMLSRPDLRPKNKRKLGR